MPAHRTRPPRALRRTVRRTLRRTLTLSLLGALLLPVAAAQGISSSLPLTSVGAPLHWTVGDQNLTLTVTSANRVKLDLYSPQLDPADYRADTYYGDETYGSGPVSTRFEVIDANGRLITRRDYAPGQQTWDTLLDQDLPAGRYTLRAITSGNGKNTFAVRLSARNAELSADNLNVNVHSHAFVPVLNVQIDGPGYQLQMYDGDGPGELEAQLRDERGRVTPLPVSGQLGTVRLPLPVAPGTYTVLLRQPQRAKQYSNTVGFSLFQSGTLKPISLIRVNTLGTLRLEAELLLPGGNVPTSLPVQVGAETVPAEPAERTLNAGPYPLAAAPVPGADLDLPAQVAVTAGQRSVVTIGVRPRVSLTLSAVRPELCVGDAVQIRATALTAYTGELPFTLTLSDDSGPLPEASRTGTFSAARPGTFNAEVPTTTPGKLAFQAKLAPWTLSENVDVTVLPDAHGLTLTHTELPPVHPGDAFTVHLSVQNTTSQEREFTLRNADVPGVTAVSPTTFHGTLQPGETREFQYQAKLDDAPSPQPGLQPGLQPVLQAVLTGAELNGQPCGTPVLSSAPVQVVTPVPVVIVAIPVPAPAPVPVPAPVPAPVPTGSRQSVLSLPFKDDAALASGDTLTVAHRFPAGGSYQHGSSTLGGAPIADPLISPSGRAYWTFPAEAAGELGYTVNHQGALPALEDPALLLSRPGGRTQALHGSIDPADLQAARPLDLKPAAPELEAPGALKLPLSGTVFRNRDRISVVTSGPVGGPAPTVNGEPLSDAMVGQRVQDSAAGTERREYLGVAITTGRNVVTFNGESAEVFLAGPTASVTFTPLSLIADGFTPVHFKVVALDAAGVASNARFLSVAASPEPLTPDADPGDAGYQIAMTDGEGELTLRPQATPVTVRLETVFGGTRRHQEFTLTPRAGAVAVGVLSVTAGLNGDGSPLASQFSVQGRASYEGPLLGGTLAVAADSAGLPGPQNLYLRAPTFGDASAETTPLRGQDPVAFTFEHPAFRAAYRQGPLGVTAFPLPENLTALTASNRSNPRVSAFVAAVPGGQQRTVLTPDGTRLLRLPNSGVINGSESVTLIVSARGQELRRELLTPGADYALDADAGVITLTRGLEAIDADFHDLGVQIDYRLQDPAAGRALAYGAELSAELGQATLAIAAAQLDGVLTSGARAKYDDGRFTADVRAALSGGVQFSANLLYRYAGTAASLQATSQSADYAGAGKFSVGTQAHAEVQQALSPTLSVSLSGGYHSFPALTPGLQTPGTPAGVADLQGGDAAAALSYHAAPWSASAGVKDDFGDVNGVAVTAAAGYHSRDLGVDLTHSQPVNGNALPVSTFGVRLAAGQAVLGFTDAYTWGQGQAATLSLGTTLGNARYAVSYDLPSAGGTGNRARFGVDSVLPLGPDFSLGIRAALLRNFALNQNEASAGADLHYSASAMQATLGGDVAFRAGAINTVLRGGLTGQLSDAFSVSADGTFDLSAATPGARAAVGYAYRSGQWNSLGYARYRSGSLAVTQAEFTAGLSAELHQPQFRLQAAVDARLLPGDAASFTYQPSVGGTLYLTDRFGVGGWARALIQPAGSSLVGYGLELSARALPGTWLNAGYNFAGFDGLSGQNGQYTRQGAYLRLDISFDETTPGGQK